MTLQEAKEFTEDLIDSIREQDFPDSETIEALSLLVGAATVVLAAPQDPEEPGPVDNPF